MSIYDADRHFKRDPVTIEPLTPARRREMTRRHLLDAAAVVFARDGFHGASLDDVAATAGFTKGAVYSNFKSKEDLFLAVFDDRFARESPRHAASARGRRWSTTRRRTSCRRCAA